MNRLDLCPLRESYAVKYGCTVIARPVPGGFSRYERAFDVDAHIVSVSYQLTHADYLYFMSFWRLWQRNPDQRFLMKLLINDDYLHDYECVFVPKSLAIAVNGRVMNVAFNVEAYGEGAVGEVRLSSKPYPLIWGDAMAVAVTASGELRDVVHEFAFADAVGVQVGIVGTLRTTTATYAANEKLSVSITLAGNLKDTVKTTVSEKLQVGMSLSGNLKDGVLTAVADKLQISVGITGSLT